MADLLTTAQNLKLQYSKSSNLTPAVFNALVDLIVSNVSTSTNTSETAIAIRNKLQTLFGDDRLDVSAIKNLVSGSDGSAAETAETIRNKLQSLVAFNRLDYSAIKGLVAANITYATSSTSVVTLQSIIDQILSSTLLMITTGDGNKFLNDKGEYITLDWSLIVGAPTNTSDFVNDGEDGSSPFITQDQLDDALLTVSSDKNYFHTQSIPSDTWVIVHNLGKLPTVVVVDSAGTTVEGSVEYSATEPLTTLTIRFNGSFSGIASLN